uniref:Putative tick kunitz 53 n=1 Tax=Ixodes ricinus TaxID=34613 RepID=V5HCD2_IXORI
MKAFIAALCFLVALSCVIAELSEDDCRRPYAVPMCEKDSLRTIYSFSNITNRCERYEGCGGGTNIFDSLPQCADGCPYGVHHPPGRA